MNNHVGRDGVHRKMQQANYSLGWQWL